MLQLFSTLAGSMVAGANGANDNGKGVATLIGARTLPRSRALWLAHLATFVGAVASIMVSRGLIRAFQGGGILSADLAGSALLLSTVAAATALTILLATWLGLPVSTTHALTGSLLGTGLVLAGSVNWSALGAKFLLPLAFSPVLSAALAAVLYPILHRWRLRLDLGEQTCVCLGPGRRWVPAAAINLSGTTAITTTQGQSLEIAVADVNECRQRYQGQVIGVSAAGLLDGVHVASAGALSFARGLNDAPKIAALLVGLTAWWTSGLAVGVVAVVMLLGGWLAARRVAHTMSDRITDLNTGSAVTANVISSILVVLASFLVLPVSTTHVTCGAIFGIGLAQGRARWKTIASIVLAWVVTLPIAAAIAAVIASFSSGI